MADDEPYLTIAQRGSADDILLQTLKPSIHRRVQTKVDGILQDVQKFSDNDKLYLYLQLPPGPSASEKSSLDVNSLSTAEHTRACNWIRNHLEEHTDTCLPKQDVYDTYKRYCDNLCCRPLSAANFGKIIREIFPNIKARRLGGRGQSKYCYSGIRRRTVVKMPSLPSLDLKPADNSEPTEVVQSYSIDVIEASCALICNWAEKILKRSFNDVVEVAQFLIQQHIISPRSPRAELVMSMAVSEVTENVQRSQKQLAPGTRNNGVEGSESATQIEKSEEKTLKCSTNQQAAEKKTAAESEKSACSTHVDALMARLPPLRPRITSAEQPVGCCTLIQSGASVIGPKLTMPPLRNSVQISPIPTALPLAAPAGPNKSGLVTLHTAPVINVILPNMAMSVAEIQIQPTGARDEMGRAGHSVETATGHLPDAQKSSAEKRPLEHLATSDTTQEAAFKKRRGRPRKVTNDSAEDAPSPSSDTEKSNGTPLGATLASSIVYGEKHSMDQTAKRAERQATDTVLKMGHARPSSACDVTPSPAARVKDSLGKKEVESIKSASSSSDDVTLEGRPLSGTRTSIVHEEEHSVDQTGERAERQATQTVLKMGHARPHSACDVSPSPAARVKDGLGKKEVDCIRSTMFRSEAVTLEGGPLPSIRSSIVHGEGHSMDQTAERAERQATHTVLKMGHARPNSACDVSPSPATREKHSLGKKDVDSISSSMSRIEPVTLEGGPLPSIDRNSENPPHVSTPSRTCQTIHSPPSGEQERRAPLPSHLEDSAEHRGSRATQDKTRVIHASDGMGEGVGLNAPCVFRSKELGSTSQVSVIQDGRHSVQKYIFGLAQVAESGKAQQVLCQNAAELIPLPGDVAHASEGPSKAEVESAAQEPSKTEPRAQGPRMASPASVLSWAVNPSKTPSDPHNSGYLFRS